MRPLSWRPRRLPRMAITPCESPTSLVTSHHLSVDGSGELSGSSLGASGRFRSVDDPDPYRSISAIHDDDFKDARQRVSAHSVTTCFAGHPATERFTPSAGFGGLASDRGVFSTPSPPSSVPLTLRRCAGSRWSASQRPPASARESFVLLGARGSRVEPVSLGHVVRAS